MSRILAIASLVGFIFQGLGSYVVEAQVASRLEEFDQVASSSDPVTMGELWNADGKVFFLSKPEFGPQRPWVTDGTRNGTRSVATYCPLGRCLLEPAVLGTLGPNLVWAQPEPDADSFRQNLEIWTSDGTVGAQPQQVRSIPDLGFARPVPGVDGALGDNKLVFDVVIGLWVTDGTEAGTFPLFQDESGPSMAGTAVVDSSLYGLLGKTLWRTDGTAGGTVEVQTFSELRVPRLMTSVRRSLLLQDGGQADPTLWTYDLDDGSLREVAPGWNLKAYDGTPVVLGGEAFFVAQAPGQGEELWRTNGTAASSRRLTNIASPTPFSPAIGQQIVAFQGEPWAILAIGGEPQLHALGDGPDSHRRIQIVNPGGRSFGPSPSTPLFAVDGGVILASPGPRCSEDIVLTDGSREGTKTFDPQMVHYCALNFSDAVQTGNQVHVFARHPNGLSRLFRFSGDGFGFSDVRGVPPFLDEPSGRWLTSLGDSWIFRLRDGVDGHDPWTLSPSRLQAFPLADLDPQRDGVSLTDVAAVGEQALFLVFDPTGDGPVNRLWTSSGEGRQLLAQGALGLDFLGEELGRVFFSETTEGGAALRATDGTAAGTSTVHSFPETGSLGPVRELGGVGLFVWSGESAPPELWSTTGTEAEKILTLADPVFPTSEALRPGQSWIVGDRLYFTTVLPGSFVSEHRLWVTDGTAAGTELLRNFGTIDRLHGAVATAEGVLLLVEARDSLDRRQASVWVTDGTASGTRRAVERNFPLSGGSITNLEFLGGEALFYAGGLWATDGTDGGTRQLAQSFGQGACRTRILAMEDRAFLPFDVEGQGCELVVTDGTAVGTRPVADLWPGTEGSYPRDLTAVGDLLYFVATTPGHGGELRVTDGTAAGTRLVHDLWPGAESSSAASFQRAGDRLFFRADDGVSGNELWTLPLASDPACEERDTAFCLNEGRFRVESRWQDFKGRRGEGHATRLTEDTGYFWFFNPDNVELMLKVLDGRENNDHHWTFFGALSNVKYWVTVTDTGTGLTRRYFNPSHNFASIGDTRSFGPLGASLDGSPNPEPLSSGGASLTPIHGRAAAGACVPSDTRLCLNEGRFAAEVTWTDFRGNVGVGTAQALTDDTGTFWFFQQENLELVVKVLDGVAINAHYWVFYGSLSNVDFDLTLTDTENGEVRVYRNRNRTFASVGDTRAFFFQ